MTADNTTRRISMRLLSCCAALGLLLVLAATADACPMCKVALSNHDEAQGDVIGGFFWSILFMLSMPFAIFGTFSGYMYLLVRRARAQQAAGQTSVARTRASAAPKAVAGPSVASSRVVLE
jgi:hypothetical protein